MTEVNNFTERIAEKKIDFRTRQAPGDFIKERGVIFAGRHLIADFWKAARLNDQRYLEDALRDAAKAAGATLLGIKLHAYSPNGGITGVALLAESHISIHTWPEYHFAAIDIFMCGTANPHRALTALKSSLKPEIVALGEHKRGVAP